MDKHLENFNMSMVEKLHRLGQDKEKLLSEHLNEIRKRAPRRYSAKIIYKTKDIVPVLVPLMAGPIANVANSIISMPKENFTSKARKGKRSSVSKAA